MIVWIVAAFMSAAAAAALLIPLIRRRGPVEHAASYDIEVYKDQLGQVGSDYDRGLLTAEEAQAAKTEISRRILNADNRRQQHKERATTATLDRVLMVVLAVAIPAAALGFYARFGVPDLPGQPFAERAGDRTQSAGGGASPTMNLNSAASQLEERLAGDPDDLDGWILLARTYMSMQRYSAAASAFQRASGIDTGNANLVSAYGEALFLAASNVVTPASRAAFERTLRRAPGNPRARFYLSLAESQAGDKQKALDGWAALFADSPADAPWLPDVRTHIREAAESLGLDVAAVTPKPRPSQDGGTGPSQADMAAAANMSPEERQNMVREMVARLADRLADNPNDFQGWMRLIRAYAVQKEKTKAMAALAKARAFFKAAPFPTQKLAALAGELGLEASGGGPQPGPTSEQVTAAQSMSPAERQEMIRGMVQRLADRLSDNPNDFQGWMRLIRSYVVQKEKAKAMAALAKAREVFKAAPFPTRKLAALAAELGLEAPGDSSQPGPTSEQVTAAQDMSPEQRREMIGSMVARLAERLKENPDDIAGWTRLAKSYNVLRQTAKAKAALTRALQGAPDNVDLLVLYGRTLRAANGDRPSRESTETMRKVLALAPDNVEALWFLGGAEAAAGNKLAAKKMWENALTQLTPGSPERAQLRQRIDALN